MNQKIAVAADHGGFQLKQSLLEWLRGYDCEIIDLGAREFTPGDDYPDYAALLAGEILSGRAQRGILICGSGVGAACAANKIPGIRAGMCHDAYSAHQGVEHDNMNVLCLGGRVIGVELAKDLIRLFLDARFSGQERHRRRLDKIAALEQSPPPRCQPQR